VYTNGSTTFTGYIRINNTQPVFAPGGPIFVAYAQIEVASSTTLLFQSISPFIVDGMILNAKGINFTQSQAQMNYGQVTSPSLSMASSRTPKISQSCSGVPNTALETASYFSAMTFDISTQLQITNSSMWPFY